jgi:hypothetical protein
VLDLPTFVARSKVPKEQPQTRNDYQPDSGENRDNSALHVKERRGTTPMTIRKEGRVAEDFGDRYLLSTGIRIHECARDIAGSEGDGTAFVVGGRDIHRGV